MAADVRLMKTAAELSLAETFAAVQNTLPGTPDVAAERAAAFETFATLGLPHRRVEAWHYTDLRALMREAMPLAAPPDALVKDAAKDKGSLFTEVEARRIYLVNGTFVPELSDLSEEEGLTIRSTAEALGVGYGLLSTYVGKTVPTSDAVVALNAALMGDGVVIHVAKDVALARPIHVVHVTNLATPAAIFTRSLVVVEDGASCSLLETFESTGAAAYQANDVLELVVGDKAKVDRVKVTAEGEGALHVGSLLAQVGAEAVVDVFNFTTGGAMVRNQLLVKLVGEGTNVRLAGASLLAGKQHGDTTLTMEHTAPHCESRESFRSVLDGQARDIFQGRITVQQAAQKTDGRMMTRALLLSEDAEADAKPELEIFADDVQCGHGCTTGALDDEMKFYLMARGIPAKEAEALLIEAFVGEVIDPIVNEKVSDALMGALRAWLLARA